MKLYTGYYPLMAELGSTGPLTEEDIVPKLPETYEGQREDVKRWMKKARKGDRFHSTRWLLICDGGRR